MSEKAQYCPIGKLVMDYFSEYIDNKNQENYTKNFSHYNDAKLFKKIKPTQTELAKTLEMYGNNGRLLKNNLSNYLRGSHPFPQDILLQVIYKLKLNASQFMELAEAYAIQHNLLEKEYHIESKNWFTPENKNIETYVKERLNTFQTDCIIYLLIVEYLDTYFKDLYIPSSRGEKDYQLTNVLLCVTNRKSLKDLAKHVFGE